MAIHIGDFWQSKQDKNVIYHVEDYGFGLEEDQNMKNTMVVVCSKIHIRRGLTGRLVFPKPEKFLWYASVDDLKKRCKLLLSTKRIAKDTHKFKTDQDIIDYLIEKVSE